MINLNKEIEELFLEEYTYIIVRNLTDKKCQCWRDGSNTPDPSCHICEGLGYVYNEWIQKCLIFFTTIDAVSHMQDFDYGKTYNNIMISYLPITLNTKRVKLNDIIYEIEYDKNPSKIKRKRKWQVVDLFDFKIENNKSQFIKILSKPLPV